MNGNGNVYGHSEGIMKMVSEPAIYDGMLRFNFLLDTCQPGTIPDANVISAVLDLV